jgi:hypothetical protein
MVNLNINSESNGIFYKLKGMEGVESLLERIDEKPKYAEEVKTKTTDEKFDEFLEDQKKTMQEMAYMPVETPAPKQQKAEPVYQEPTEAEMSIVNGIKERENYNMRMIMLRGNTQQKSLAKALKRWNPAKYQNC